MSELKPCPFCGGKAVIATEYDMDGFGNFHKIKCRKCGASSNAHFCTQGNECPQYYQEVRDDWQARALTPKQQCADDMYEMLDQICISMHKIDAGTIEDILAIEALLTRARGEA